MTRNEMSCSAWRLYVIVDRAAVGTRDVADVAEEAIRGGADVIQLRDKAASTRQLHQEALRVRAVTKAAGIPLIINDHVDIAHAVGADGVHLGQDDLPIAAARAILGPNRLIGRSTHSLEQAIAAELDGADYIGVGPIFPTPTKPGSQSVGVDLIRQVALRLSVPFVCIGGIDTTTLQSVLSAGAERIAVVRAVCGAANPHEAAAALKQRLITRHHAAP